MIKENCFAEEWLDQFKKQKEHKRVDKIILQKMIYALHLLERLQSNRLDFVFKGGTSLVLLLKEGNRFSIDIDIICKTSREYLEDILNNVIDSSHFTKWELDDHRSYKPGVPKAHYKFYFNTERQGSGTIILDVLIDNSIYPEIIEIPIETKWIETDEKTMVKVPSIDAITGDKLTAFAPNTIGIPYFKGKDQQPFSMEICKQLFDLSKLFEHIKNMEIVSESFKAFAGYEIEYRKSINPDLELTPDKVLKDTIDTCALLTKRHSATGNETALFKELQRGIIAFGTGYLMKGTFRIDNAIQAAARIACLAAKISVNDFSPIKYYDEQDISKLNIESKDWSFLNKLKRQPDKSGFFYWHQAINLIR